MALRYNERTGMFDEIPDNPRINSFTFDGSPIRYKGESITLMWNVQDAQRIFINEIEVPVSSSSYSYQLSDIGLRDFVLRIENGGNQMSENIQIKVLDVPFFNIEKSKDKLKKGKNEFCDLKWKINNAQSVRLLYDEKEVNIGNEGCLSVSPQTSTDYRFEAVGEDGERVFPYSVHVDVFDESSVVFEVDKNITLPHVPIKLSWDVKNASDVELSGYGIVEHKSEKVFDCDRDKTFSLKVTDVFGTTVYHQKVRMYPLPLIRSILVPTPKIEKKINVETHFEQKHIQININVNMAKIPDFTGIKADVFVHCIDFHKLSIPLTTVWSEKIESCKRLFCQLIQSHSIRLENISFIPRQSCLNTIREHQNILIKRITSKLSSLWNR